MEQHIYMVAYVFLSWVISSSSFVRTIPGTYKRWCPCYTRVIPRWRFRNPCCFALLRASSLSHLQAMATTLSATWSIRTFTVLSLHVLTITPPRIEPHPSLTTEQLRGIVSRQQRAHQQRWRWTAWRMWQGRTTTASGRRRGRPRLNPELACSSRAPWTRPWSSGKATSSTASGPTLVSSRNSPSAPAFVIVRSCPLASSGGSVELEAWSCDYALWFASLEQRSSPQPGVKTWKP